MSRQADALLTVKLSSLKTKVDELIKEMMAKHFNYCSSPESIDTTWASADTDKYGITTSEWRALRKFAAFDDPYSWPEDAEIEEYERQLEEEEELENLEADIADDNIDEL